MSVASARVGIAEEPAATEAPKVRLDQLMRLPDSYRADPAPLRGKGLGAEHWRERFATADRDLLLAEKDLANAQAAQGQQVGSSSSWQMSAPGVFGAAVARSDGEQIPLSFRLREAVRKRKQELEQAKRTQRDLIVEADLASVPEGWRRPQEATEIVVKGGESGQ